MQKAYMTGEDVHHHLIIILCTGVDSPALSDLVRTGQTIEMPAPAGRQVMLRDKSSQMKGHETA